MTQYVDKADLIAEIERIKKSISPDRFLSEFEDGCNQGKKDVCDDLISFLDILEVKDVAKEKQQLIDEACKWLFVNDSYAIPTNVQVDRLREHLNKMKGE